MIKCTNNLNHLMLNVGFLTQADIAINIKTHRVAFSARIKTAVISPVRMTLLNVAAQFALIKNNKLKEN